MSIDLMRLKPHFIKNRECPLTQVKSFAIKLGFICTFLTCPWACSSARKKLRSAIKKNYPMLIYTFRFFKTKQMRFSSLVDDENKASFRRRNWRKYTQKNSKNIAEGYRENRALTELPIMCFWYCTRNA